MTDGPQRERYAVGDLVLDVEQGTVARRGEALPLPPRTFELLLVLARRSPERVRRHELLETVWPREVVTDQTLSHRVLLLRRALGDETDHPRYLASDRGWGYHLVAPVERLRADAPRPPPERAPATLHPRARALVSGAPLLAAAGLALVLPVRSRDTEGDARPALVAVAALEVPADDVAGEYLARRLGDRIAMRLEAEPRLRVVRGETAGGGTPRLRVEGSTRPAPGGAFLELRLAEPASGRVLWSTTVTKPVYELFDAEESLVSDAVAATRRALDLPREVPGRAPTRAEVADLCLRGEWLLRSWQGPSLRQAARMFERALALDGTSAAAHAGLSLTRTTLALLGEVPAGEAAAPARAGAREALRFGPGLAPSHAAQGLARLVFDGDLDAAAADLRRALEAGPRDVITLVTQAFYLQAIHQPDASLLALRSASEEDPYAAPVPYLEGRAHYLAGRPRAALEAYARALRLDPYLALARLGEAHAHAVLGQGAAALEALLQERRLAGASARTLSALERAHSAGGLRGLWGLVCDDPEARGGDPVRAAAACARAGRREQALDWVRRGRAERATALLTVAVDPAFDALRGEALSRLLRSPATRSPG